MDLVTLSTKVKSAGCIGKRTCDEAAATLLIKAGRSPKGNKLVPLSNPCIPVVLWNSWPIAAFTFSRASFPSIRAIVAVASLKVNS